MNDRFGAMDKGFIDDRMPSVTVFDPTWKTASGFTLGFELAYNSSYSKLAAGLIQSLQQGFNDRPEIAQ